MQLLVWSTSGTSLKAIAYSYFFTLQAAHAVYMYYSYMFIHICVPEKGRAQALHVMCEREYGTQYKLQVNSSYYE